MKCALCDSTDLVGAGYCICYHCKQHYNSDLYGSMDWTVLKEWLYKKSMEKPGQFGFGLASSASGKRTINWSDSAINTSSTGLCTRQFVPRMAKSATFDEEAYEPSDEVYVSLIACMQNKYKAEGPYTSFKSVDDLLEYVKKRNK